MAKSKKQSIIEQVQAAIAKGDIAEAGRLARADYAKCQLHSKVYAANTKARVVNAVNHSWIK